MGVKTLWSIISGSGELIDLRELQGSTVAIDLAGWIVQNNTFSSAGSIARPHLRNLFFRVASMVSLNIKPIFVLDGDAPDLKKETMEARRKAENPDAPEVKNFSRARLKSLMGECKSLLDALGISSVKAEGEAEQLCAKLNAEGVVNAVISDDSDSFCYGAKVLLRNFSISNSGNAANVERFTSDKIDQSLKLDRNRLIFMAIILGCDFCPNGVPGVGKETVMQLFEAWPKSWNVLDVLRHWITTEFSPKILTKCKGAQKMSYDCVTCDNIDHCDDCNQWSMAVNSWAKCHCQMLKENKVMFKLEESLKKKCKELSEFWHDTFEKVIDEFMKPCNNVAVDKVRCFQMNCPKLDEFVKICVKKMIWTEEYAVEKFLPLITRWQVRNDQQKIVQPKTIVKQRTVHGTPSFTVSWEWIGTKPSLAPETFETCEPKVYLSEFCHELIDEFESKKKKPKKVKQKLSSVIKTQTTADKPATQITQFFKETKKTKQPTISKEPVIITKTKQPKQNVLKEKPVKSQQTFFDLYPLDIPKNKPLNALAHNTSLMSEDEQLPDNLSLLVEDILSHRFKRNLSIEQPPKEIVTSTPVMKGPRTKKLITPSKVFNYPKPKLQVDDLVERSPESKENLMPKKKTVKPKVGGASVATYGSSSRCSSGSGKNGNSGCRENKAARQNNLNSNKVHSNYSQKPPLIDQDNDFKDSFDSLVKNLEFEDNNPVFMDNNSAKSRSNCQDPKRELVVNLEDDFEDSFDRMCNVKSDFGSKRK